MSKELTGSTELLYSRYFADMNIYSFVSPADGMAIASKAKRTHLVLSVGIQHLTQLSPALWHSSVQYIHTRLCLQLGIYNSVLER